MDTALLLESSTKILLYAALLVAIGGSALRWVLLPRVLTELGADRVLIFERATARLALLAAGVALAASALRVWTHTESVFGFEGARSWDTIKLIALQSRWGHGWKPQIIAALILVLASAATVWRRAAWPLATLAVAIFTVTIPLLGHAAGSNYRLALHAVHILAAGVWLGTLAAIVCIRVPSTAVSIGPPVPVEKMRLIILRRFSPLAIFGAAVVTAAGLVAAYTYLGAVSNLWLTGYGRVLVLKVALVGAVLLCGFTNWRRLHRFRVEELSSRSIILHEVALAVAVVVVTGFLTETGHP